MKILTPEEQDMFVKTIKNYKIGTAVIFTLFTGLRVGELLGLKYSDISFDDKTMKISRTIQRVKTFAKVGPKTIVVEGTPKSESGIGTIPLLDNLILL